MRIPAAHVCDVASRYTWNSQKGKKIQQYPGKRSERVSVPSSPTSLSAAACPTVISHIFHRIWKEAQRL
ncbi:hypothetical protein TNCV_1735601 [Trichonephila clavipes]|nr:hypothetical protein TNCV_1735601 [Trichonephila clavipes]